MHFASLLAVATIAISSVTATPLFNRETDVEVTVAIGFNLTVQNNYGAPIPPWAAGALPGWYDGQSPALYPDLPCLGNGQATICSLLSLVSDCIHCPSPIPIPPVVVYVETFNDLTGATQASDYITYGLVDTVADCQAMCNSVTGCAFVNTYHDVNGKGGSTQLTCSLFSKCHTSSDATNTGGQTQPNGSVDYITNSDGWCSL